MKIITKKLIMNVLMITLAVITGTFILLEITFEKQYLILFYLFWWIMYGAVIGKYFIVDIKEVQEE